jgi:putative phage-type endonuclease
MGVSEYKSARMVWKQKIDPKPVEINDAMQRGIDLEPVARAYFNSKYGTNFQPAVVLSDARPWQMASLDGWDAEKKWILEIKCPGEKVFQEVKSGKEPKAYVYQCLHQLSVADEAVHAILFFYWVDSQGEVQTIQIVVGRNDALIDSINEKERKFYFDNLLGWKEPEPSKLDYIERYDWEWDYYTSAWLNVKKELDELELEEKELREKLLELSGGHSTIGCGLKATRYEVEGRVDYARVPELQGVDLTPYRKPASERWRLSKCDPDEG